MTSKQDGLADKLISGEVLTKNKLEKTYGKFSEHLLSHLSYVQQIGEYDMYNVLLPLPTVKEYDKLEQTYFRRNVKTAIAEAYQGITTLTSYFHDQKEKWYSQNEWDIITILEKIEEPQNLDEIMNIDFFCKAQITGTISNYISGIISILESTKDAVSNNIDGQEYDMNAGEPDGIDFTKQIHAGNIFINVLDKTIGELESIVLPSYLRNTKVK